MSVTGAPQHGTTQSPRFGAGLPVTPLRWREYQKDVLFSTDVDHTLLGWLSDEDDKVNQRALEQTRQVLKQRRKHMAIHLNTGRGLTAIKSVAPFLKGFPVDYLSVNNGQELYINRRKNRDAAAWIGKLDASDQVRISRKKLRQSGWDTRRAMALLADVFRQAGFVPDTQPKGNPQYNNATCLQATMNGHTVGIEYYPDQPGFYLHPNIITESGKPLAETLAEQWKARLKKENLHINLVDFYSGAQEEPTNSSYAVYMGFPEGISKATAVEDLIAARLPNLDGVITAGDSATNDHDFLAPETYAGKLLNHPIVSGKSGRLAQKMADHPRAISTYTATLAPALEKHFHAITQPGQRLNLSA